jgi:hypothetical protein
VLRVTDFGEHDRYAFLALEFVAGEDPQTVVRTDSPMDPVHVARLLVPIADALEHCHQQGLILARWASPESREAHRCRRSAASMSENDGWRLCVYQGASAIALATSSCGFPWRRYQTTVMP